MRDPLIGASINRYEIREAVHKSDVIGIYKAYDTKLERFVLIKTILHSHEYSREAVDYFLAESRSLAKLAHPNIAKVLDFGYENGNLYLVSEFVPGVSLSDSMNNPMPWQTAVNILLPLTGALIYAHSRGIIHRDLKPDNIIINNDSQPILSDFSLMRIIEEEETRDMTGTNVGLGSPEYISPEQGQGLPVDFRSDIYSLGVIFFEMVTGKKLFYATSSMEIVIQHIMADPPKPRSIIPALPKMVEAVILNALSKEREKRYQAMDEFAGALKAIIEAANREKNKSARRPRRLAIFSGIGVGLLLLAIGYLFWMQTQAATVPASTGAHTLPAHTETPRLTFDPPPVTATPDFPKPTTSASPSDDPFADYQLPALPVLAGTKLPSSNQALTVDNVNAIQELARWEKPDIRQLAMINNDRVLLAATGAGIYFFDPKDLSARLFFDTQGGLVALAVSDDEEWVATADVNGVIAIWNMSNGERIHQLRDKNYTAKTILSIDFSPDKAKLVFSDNARNIHFWNIRQDQYYPFKKRLGANANKVLFLDTGETVISGGDEHRIMFWDVANADLLREKTLATSQSINDMALSSDNRYLAVALDEAAIEIWDLFAGQRINTIKDPAILKAFTHIAFLPNQNTILTGSADGFVRAWNIAGSSPLWEVTSAGQYDLPGIINPVRSMMVTKNDSRFVIGFADGLVETWDLVSQTREAARALGTVPIKRAVISPHDRVVAVQGGDDYVEILDMADGMQSARMDGALPRGYPISSDNAMISIVPPGRLKELELYSLSVASPEKLFTFYDFPVFGLVNYSPDNKILTAYENNIFSYWSTISGRELKESLPKRTNQCYTIFRRDGSFISAASANGVVYLDDHLDFFCQTRRSPFATSEEFLPDGSIIAASLLNQRVEVWNAHTDGQRHEITAQTPGDVLDIAVSLDGKLLAGASHGGTIEIYSLETLTHIKTLSLSTGPVNQVLFTHDGKYLIAGMEDGTLRIFGLHP